MAAEQEGGTYTPRNQEDVIRMINNTASASDLMDIFCGLRDEDSRRECLERLCIPFSFISEETMGRMERLIEELLERDECEHDFRRFGARLLYRYLITSNIPQRAVTFAVEFEKKLILLKHPQRYAVSLVLEKSTAHSTYARKTQFLSSVEI